MYPEKGTSMSEKKVKPSAWFYVLAGLVLVGGMAGFVFFLIGGLSDLSGGLTQVVVPGSQELTFSKSGTYTVFHEHKSIVGNKMYSMTPGGLAGLQCRMVSKTDGQEVSLSPTRMNSTYSMGSRSGVGVFDFTIDSPGEYLFSAKYPADEEGPQAVLAVGHGFVEQLLKTVFGGIGIMFGSLAAAIAIALTTFFMRRGSRKQLGEIPEVSVYQVPPQPPIVEPTPESPSE
jgi:hypothetical protein